MTTKFLTRPPSDPRLESMNQRVIIARPQRHVNAIVEHDCTETQSLPNGVLHACRFTPAESGQYHVAMQLCVVNVASAPRAVDVAQYGVCRYTETMEDHASTLTSQLVGAPCPSGMSQAFSMASICRLEAGVEYTCWLNLLAEAHESFQFRKDLSHVRLYKL